MPYTAIQPDQVIPTLKKHVLVDGFHVIIDLARSHGSFIRDALTGRRSSTSTPTSPRSPWAQPPARGAGPGVPAGAAGGGDRQSRQLRHLHHGLRRLRRDLRRDRQARALQVPVLRRRRGAGRGERVEDGLRLEGAAQPGARQGRPRPPDPALPRGVPRAQRLHDVFDQHRSDEDGVLSRSSTGRASSTPSWSSR